MTNIRDNSKFEFFWLRDDRREGDVDLLSDVNLEDDNPSRTKFLGEQYIRKTQLKYPHWRPGDSNPLGLDGVHTVRLASSELSPETFFDRDAPCEISHFETVPVLGFNLRHNSSNVDGFICVSPQWAEAVEFVEPGIHEFHPFKIKFKNGISFDRFLFRPMHATSAINFELSNVTDEAAILFRDQAGPVPRITLFGATVSGKHWVQQWRSEHGPAFYHLFFVSQKLGQKLVPLLPSRVVLQPVALA